MFIRLNVKISAVIETKDTQFTMKIPLYESFWLFVPFFKNRRPLENGGPTAPHTLHMLCNGPAIQ